MCGAQWIWHTEDGGRNPDQRPASWEDRRVGIITVLWEKWTEFRRDFFKITLAAMISPLMYLMIFGLGIQTTSHGEPYLNYLIPGVVSMATMTAWLPNALLASVMSSGSRSAAEHIEILSAPEAIMVRAPAMSRNPPPTV